LEFITKPADFDLLKAQLRQLSEVACEPIDAQRGRLTAHMGMFEVKDQV
jgi:hypothetical protein